MPKPLNVSLETAALEKLKIQLAEHIRDDPDFVLSLAEGETSLLEALDQLLVADAVDVGMRDGIDAAIDLMRLRRERFTKRIEARRKMIAQAVEAIGQTKLPRPSATLVMAKQSAKVQVTDETEVPVEYFRKETKLVIDKDKLDAAIKAGATVPGATLNNAPPQLRIIRK